MTEPAPEGRVVHRRERRSWMAAVPLLVIPVLAYVTFAGAGADFGTSRFTVTLPSLGLWQIALGDMGQREILLMADANFAKGVFVGEIGDRIHLVGGGVAGRSTDRLQ